MEELNRLREALIILEQRIADLESRPMQVAGLSVDDVLRLVKALRK